jgi:hypothetical protein
MSEPVADKPVHRAPLLPIRLRLATQQFIRNLRLAHPMPTLMSELSPDIRVPLDNITILLYHRCIAVRF